MGLSVSHTNFTDMRFKPAVELHNLVMLTQQLLYEKCMTSCMARYMTSQLHTAL